MATAVAQTSQVPKGMRPEVAAAASHEPDVMVRRLHRFTVKQFQAMVEEGIFSASDRVELLEGWVVNKMTQHPPHAVASELTKELLRQLVPQGWHVREQKPITTPKSQPEPDLAVVRGNLRRYTRQHPRSRDVAVVIEVADSTLAEDREFKSLLYAGARIPIYWIINLPDSRVEVYTHPKVGKEPHYRQRQDYGVDDTVPVVIDGREIGRLAVRDLLP